MPHDKTLDTESPSHQRPPFADPLADGADPTAPGSPHEPGGVDYNQSRADKAGDNRPESPESGDDRKR